MGKLVTVTGILFILLFAVHAVAQEEPVPEPGETVETLPVDPDVPKPPAEEAKPGLADEKPGETVDSLPVEGTPDEPVPEEGAPEGGVIGEKQPGDAIPTDAPPVAEKKEEKKPEEKKRKAFKGGELFSGRFVKQPPGAKTFEIGLTVQAAPFNLLLQTAKGALMDELKSQAKNEFCKNATDQAVCEQGMDDNMDAALWAVQNVPDGEIDALAAAMGDTAALDAKLEASGITDKDATQVKSAMDSMESSGLSPDDISGVLKLSKQIAGSDAMSVLVEPNLDLNFKLLALSFKLPIATYYVDNEANWNVGNFYSDVKFGHIFGPDLAAFGLSYGVSVYAPTGTRKASAMALSDLSYGPKFMHEYLTTSPYLIMGFDLPIITLQAYGEYVNMYPARNVDLTGMQYMRYGGSVVFLSRMPISVIAEINGLYPLDDNSKMYKAIFGLAGVRLRLLWLRAGIAVQVPVPGYGPEPEDMGSIAGVELGELAQWSIIGRASLTF